MVGMSKSNFPSLPAFPTAGVVKITGQVLRGLIARTCFAISSEESRYTLNGALMLLKPESITMVATDGHRLAHCERSGEKFEGISGEMKTLVPKKAMDELKSLLDSTDADTVEFAKDDSTLYFRIGSRLLTSRQLTGQFPNFEAVLPKDNSKSITLNNSDLNSAILRVAQFGESEDSIEAPYDGETLTIGFNAQYLVDFLKASGTDEVRLELKDSQSAGQFRPAEGDDYKYRYIVMPMRI
jgi:DNA polymerase-3 subunit beta